MLKMKFTVNGKDYTNDISGGIESMMHKAVMDRMQEILGPLADEINAEGGEISFDLQTSKVAITNCSPELIEKIQNAMNQA